MAKRKRAIPQYGTVTLNGIDYYRTRVQNADGKLVALYARTPEELYDKELGALEQIDNDTFCRKSPTVADYCEKWLLMQSVHVRATTLIDYTSKVRRHIIKELGQMRMADVTLDDIQLALVPVSEKSASVYNISQWLSCINPFSVQQRKVRLLITTQRFTLQPKVEAFRRRTKLH